MCSMVISVICHLAACLVCANKTFLHYIIYISKCNNNNRNNSYIYYKSFCLKIRYFENRFKFMFRLVRWRVLSNNLKMGFFGARFGRYERREGTRTAGERRRERERELASKTEGNRWCRFISFQFTVWMPMSGLLRILFGRFFQLLPDDLLSLRD